MSGEWCQVNQSGKGTPTDSSNLEKTGMWIWIIAVVIGALCAAGYIWYRKSVSDEEEDDDELINPYNDNIEM